MKHPHAWNWDRKEGRNLCYKHNQQNQTSCSLEYQTMEKVQKSSNSVRQIRLRDSILSSDFAIYSNFTYYVYNTDILR
jgi:hypothetical protein